MLSRTCLGYTSNLVCVSNSIDRGVEATACVVITLDKAMSNYRIAQVGASYSEECEVEHYYDIYV